MRGTHDAPWGGKSGESTRHGTAQVIGGIAVAAGKSGAAQSQNLLHVDSRHALCQQSACDPEIYDAPIRLREALRNAPAPHPGLIDRAGLRAGRVRRGNPWSRRGKGRLFVRGVVARLDVGASSLQEALGLARQTGSGMQDFHPRRIAVDLAAMRLLIVSTQVTVFCLRFLLTGVRI
jgi:hypothetical protein